MDGPQVVPEHYKEVNRDAEGLQYIPPPQPPQPPPVAYENGAPYGHVPYYTPPETLYKQPRSEKKTVCGLQPIVFWLFMIIVVIILAGAIGGGVGGSLANKSNDNTTNNSPQSTTHSASSTSSSTSSPQGSSTTASATSSAVTSGTTGLTANPCPGKNETTIRASTGSLFSVLCSVDWPKGVNAADGNGTVEDLDYTTEYTLDACIAACVDYNKESTSSGSTCKGVTYAANLTAAFDGGQGGNCYLKDGVGSYFPGESTTICAGMIGG